MCLFNKNRNAIRMVINNLSIREGEKFALLPLPFLPLEKEKPDTQVRSLKES